MFEVAAFLVIIGLVFLIIRIAKMIRRNSYEDDVWTLFHIFWSGLPEDELYAWFIVRQILLEREDKRRKIDFVNRKISDINKQALYSNVSVSASGELIDEPASQYRTH